MRAIDAIGMGFHAQLLVLRAEVFVNTMTITAYCVLRMEITANSDRKVNRPDGYCGLKSFTVQRILVSNYVFSFLSFLSSNDININESILELGALFYSEVNNFIVITCVCIEGRYWE